jgi:hypothetical protein
MRQRPFHLLRYPASVVLATLLAACGATPQPSQSPEPSLTTFAVQPRQAARDQTWAGRAARAARSSPANARAQLDRGA